MMSKIVWFSMLWQQRYLAMAAIAILGVAMTKPAIASSGAIPDASENAGTAIVDSAAKATQTLPPTVAAPESIPAPESIQQARILPLPAPAPATDTTNPALPELQTDHSEKIAQVIHRDTHRSNPSTWDDDLGNAQVTSVSQLSDVRPTDWAFQALQSLVERYGCIVGYPDKTYRGNQALSRFEFAAGLNACMDRVSELIAAGTADLVKKEDLLVLQKLQEEFAAELATLRGRVDALEARTATLEKQQFSTTTKLVGEVIFAITDEFGQPTENNTVFQDRVRLDFQTSFSGKDTLHTRIAAGNADVFSLRGDGVEGLQTFNFGNTSGNKVYIDWLGYFFPVGEKLQVYIPALAGLQYDYAPTVSSYLENYDGGNGALSIFGQRNPIYLIGGGSGIGITYALSEKLSFSAGYLADNSDPDTSSTGSLNFAANNPSEKNGLFNGSYSALAQLTFTPSEKFSIGLTYINAYRRFSIFDTGSAVPSVGTNLANGLVGLDSSPVASKVNAFGVSATYQFSPRFAVNGWFSYINADFVGSGNNGEIWTYALTLAFPDLGRKGNLGGIVAGVEPYLGNARDFVADARNSLPIHLEAFYKWQLTDNISLTPGIIWIIAPGQNSDNPDALIGTLRTTFTF